MLSYDRGQDCIKMLCKDLKKEQNHLLEKKEMIALTDKENKSYENQKRCYIWKTRLTKDNKKVRDHCHFIGKYRGAAHNKCNMNYKITKDIPVIFHSSSTYAYHLMIKELVKEFEGEFECLGENTEKYIIFFISINKNITKKDKDGNDKIVNIPYRLKFVDSYRFMSAPLSSLVDNLSDGLHKCKDCESSIEYINARDSKVVFKCLNCNKNYNIDFNNELINRFSSTYNFSERDINKFILLLRKAVYPYEYMDSWERFDETSLPNKENFYSCLNMEDITDIDYKRAKKVFREIKINNLGGYHDLYVKSDTLLLADILENFRNMCLETHELDPAYFLSLPELAWQVCFKITGTELELLTDRNMLLMVEEGIKGEITQVSHGYAKANNKYMKNYDKNEESSFLMYLDANNLYGCPMTEKLPVGGFKWVKMHLK